MFKIVDISALVDIQCDVASDVISSTSTPGLAYYHEDPSPARQNAKELAYGVHMFIWSTFLIIKNTSISLLLYIMFFKQFIGPPISTMILSNIQKLKPNHNQAISHITTVKK